MFTILKWKVPEDEDVMGIIIGRRGSNINEVTSSLQEKGLDLSRIILHAKSRDEIKMKLESIEKL